MTGFPTVWVQEWQRGKEKGVEKGLLERWEEQLHHRWETVRFRWEDHAWVNYSHKSDVQFWSLREVK